MHVQNVYTYMCICYNTLMGAISYILKGNVIINLI